MSSSNGSDASNTDAVSIVTLKSTPPNLTSRTTLPAPTATQKVSLWSVLKKSIGKDLTRVTIPVYFNEPLSFLQRLAEYMEYISLIKEAAITKDPFRRLELISAFALSTSATSSTRLSKPFNPLLYETYELSKPDLGFEFIAEQVSHHPPISAFYSRGDEFEFYGNVEFKIKFWGRSVEISQQSNFTLHLKTLNEKYTWQGIPCYVHNLYMGKMYMCWTGTMNIKCLGTDLQTEIKFAGPTKNGPDTMLYGEVFQGKNVIRVLYGNWTEYIASTPQGIYSEMKHQWKKEYKSVEKSGNNDLITVFPDSAMIWRVHSKPPNNKDYYNMTYFAMMLNETLDESAKLAPTDSRFRPDIRFMEEGDLDSASNEKERLEDKQRSKAKPRPPPQWFSADKNGTFIFNGNYWKRDFSKFLIKTSEPQPSYDSYIYTQCCCDSYSGVEIGVNVSKRSKVIMPPVSINQLRSPLPSTPTPESTKSKKCNTVCTS